MRRLLTPFILLAIVLSMSGCYQGRDIVYPTPVTSSTVVFPQVTVVQAPFVVTPTGERP